MVPQAVGDGSAQKVVSEVQQHKGLGVARTVIGGKRKRKRKRKPLVKGECPGEFVRQEVELFQDPMIVPPRKRSTQEIVAEVQILERREAIC